MACSHAIWKTLYSNDKLIKFEITGATLSLSFEKFNVKLMDIPTFSMS